MRRNGALIQLQGEDIPFGIRAIQSGIKIEGVWLSKQNSPAASIRSWDPRSSPVDLGPPLDDYSHARAIGGDAASSRLSVLVSDEHQDHLCPAQATTSPEFSYASSIQSEFFHVAGNQYLQKSNPVLDASDSTGLESFDSPSSGISPRGEHEEWLANDARRRRHHAIEMAPETARAHIPFDQYIPDFPARVRTPRDYPGSYRIDRGAEGMAWSPSESSGNEAQPQFPSTSPSGPINSFKSQQYSGTSFSDRMRNQYHWRGESESLASTGHTSTDQTSRRMGSIPSYEVPEWMEDCDRPSRRRPLSIESQVDMLQKTGDTLCLSSLSSGSPTQSLYADCESIGDAAMGDAAMAKAPSTLEPEQNELFPQMRAVQQGGINRPAHTRRTSRIVNSGFEVLSAGTFKSPSASEDKSQRNLNPATNMMTGEAGEVAGEHLGDGRRAPSKRLITMGYH